MHRRLVIAFQATIGLAQAWIIKSRKTMANIRLAPPSNSSCLTDPDISFVLGCSDFLVKLGARRTGRKCFFRSFIMASVLRKWGLPVIMNVGLRGLRGARRTDGHCWLTLDGKPFGETDNPNRDYPVQLDQGINGVQYWLG